MADQHQSRGGGIFIVLSIAVCTAIGTAMRQPSAGVVIGVAVGSAIALGLWLRDREKAGE